MKNQSEITHSPDNNPPKKPKNSHYLSIGSKPGKIPELDGLRACAIILVLIFHYATYYREHHGSYFVSLFPQTIQNFMFNGWIGVDLFFVLSGYLIFHHLLSMPQDNKAKYFGRYALKRVLRTFPLYYAIILLIGLSLIPFYSPNIAWSDYLIHLFFLQDYVGETILVPLWSLATEEKFYLLAPFLLLLTRRLSIAQSVTLIMTTLVLMTLAKSLAINQAEPITNYITFFSQYRAPFHYAVLSIGVGVVIALLAQLEIPRKLPMTALFSTILIIAILFLTNMYRTENWHWVNFLHVLITLLFGILTWVCIKKSGMGSLRLLTGRTLRVVSTLSYALYLTHYAVLPWTNKLHKAHIYSEEAWVHAGSFFLIYLGLTVAFALALHYIVEKPFLMIKDRL